MTLGAGAAAPGFFMAALLSALGPRFGVAARALAVVSALLFIPAIDVPSAWPSLGLAVGAAVLASPLPCLLAAAGATLATVRPEAAGAPIAPAVLALATALAAGAVSSTVRSRLDGGAPPARLAGLAGAALLALLLRLDDGRVLHGAFGMSSGASRLELPGAGLLLGLALLSCLGGTLLLLAHLLAPAVAGAVSWAWLLLPGATLGVLAVAHITLQGLLQKKDALAAAVTDVAALVLLTGVLACALARDFADIPASSRPDDGRAARETALAVALTWLAVAVAGGEGWGAEGTYVSPSVVRVASAGLLGIAAVVPTRLPGTRRLLLLAALVGALLPEALGLP